jgi:hypothetical protein
MSEPQPSEKVHRLVEERSSARSSRNWERADAIRDELAALGWQVQDSSTGTSLRPILGRTDHDAPEEERLAGAPSVEVSLQVVADDHPDDLRRLLGGLAAHPPSVTWELVVVANAPTYDLDAVLAEARLPVEPRIVRKDERLGWADSRTLALRQSRGEITILLDSSVEPIGDLVAPLLAAFDDLTVGIAGGWGVRSRDARQFEESPPGEVDAVEGYCLAVRREALRAVGGFDRRFRFYRNADLDFSFAVRDAGWRAVRTEPLPLERHEHRGWTSLPDDERDRLSRRNFYRFLDRWGRRRDLLLDPAPEATEIR